ncbi:MAG: hypothetical protein LBB75_02095 [Oscillospiraceae bacterium]|jgi:predicted Rdx family selenoprotein|nr:hypothetical protein [Oscillospiraceae bacterium]
MEYWMRSATLQIGPRRYSMDTLDFSFEIPFTDTEELTQATIEVRNLSESTRKAIRKGDTVIVNAGYENDVGAIFVGQAGEPSHKRDRVDWVTKILATAALEEWLTKEVNKTYNKNIKASAVVPDLLNLFGIEVGQMQLVQDATYPRGKVCKGKLKDILTEITTSDCKSRFLIKNGQLIINDPNNGDNRGYVLSAATGLLKVDDEAVTTQATTPQTTKDSEDQKSDKENLVKLEALLNYHIGPGDVVTVKSQKRNGRFLVKKGVYVGSRTGEWRIKMEARPL